MDGVLVTPALHRFHHTRAGLDRDHDFGTSSRSGTGSSNLLAQLVRDAVKVGLAEIGILSDSAPRSCFRSGAWNASASRPRSSR